MSLVSVYIDQLCSQETYQKGFFKLEISFSGQHAKIVGEKRHGGPQALQINNSQLLSCPLRVLTSMHVYKFQQCFNITNFHYPLGFEVKLSFCKSEDTQPPQKRYKQVYSSAFTVIKHCDSCELLEVPLSLSNYAVLRLVIGGSQRLHDFSNRAQALLAGDAYAEAVRQARHRFISHYQQYIVENDSEIIPEQRQSADVRQQYAIMDDGCVFQQFRHPSMQITRIQYKQQDLEAILKSCGCGPAVCQLVRDWRNALPQQPKIHQSKVHVVVFVHGFMGCWCDFRELKDRLINILQYSDNIIPILCSQFYTTSLPELDLLDLGHRLAVEVTGQISRLCGPDNACLGAISFIGFSLGNIVVQACIQTIIFQQLLPFLKVCVALNGPFLGSAAPRAVVSLGTGCVKCFSGAVCLGQLENAPIRPKQYSSKYEMAGQLPCEHIQALSFLSLFSCAGAFRAVLLLGSGGDGYVREQSAQCIPQDAQEGRLMGWFAGCGDVRRYAIAHPSAKRRQGSLADVVSGRNVHVMPLVDQQTISVVAVLVGEALEGMTGAAVEGVAEVSKE